MPTTLPQHVRKASVRKGRVLGRIGWTAAALSVPAVAAGLTANLASELVLPALAMILVVSGLTLEAFRSMGLTAGAVGERGREIAAGLVLIGFTAAILSDGDAVVRAFEEPARVQGGQAGQPDRETAIR